MFRSDIYVDWGKSPRIVWVEAPSTELTIQDLIDTLRTLEQDLDNLDDQHILNAAGKDDLGGGVYVGLTATLVNAYVAFEARTTPLIVSAATADDPIWLYDTTKDFVALGAEVGSVVQNVTDQSCGTVLEVQEHAVRLNALEGGTLNVWTTGDNYKLYNVARCEISGGNLVAVDALGVSMDCTLPTANVSIVRTSSSSATLQELEAIQYSSYGNQVTVDVTGSHSGTVYPTGTLETPVNNFADALTIANDKGFDTIFIIGNATLTGVNADGITFVGQSIVKTVFTVDASAMTLGCVFQNMTIQGVLDGDSYIQECRVLDIVYLEGMIQDSMLTGSIVVAGGYPTFLINCYSGSNGIGSVFTVDMAASTQELSIKNYAGMIRFTNLVNSQALRLDFLSGHLEIDNTCSTGNIIIRGIVGITDNHTGTCVVNTDDVVSQPTVSNAVWDKVPTTPVTDSYGDYIVNKLLTVFKFIGLK